MVLLLGDPTIILLILILKPLLLRLLVVLVWFLPRRLASRVNICVAMVFGLLQPIQHTMTQHRASTA